MSFLTALCLLHRQSFTLNSYSSNTHVQYIYQVLCCGLVVRFPNTICLENLTSALAVITSGWSTEEKAQFQSKTLQYTTRRIVNYTVHHIDNLTILCYIITECS